MQTKLNVNTIGKAGTKFNLKVVFNVIIIWNFNTKSRSQGHFYALYFVKKMILLTKKKTDYL